MATARQGGDTPTAAASPTSTPATGQQWFGAGDILPPALLGNNNHDQVANEVFWDFFSRFRL